MKLPLEEIAHWIGADSGCRQGDPAEQPATGYSIDTRTLAPGDLFFAIRGERFDAHDFVALRLSKARARRWLPAARRAIS